MEKLNNDSFENEEEAMSKINNNKNIKTNYDLVFIGGGPATLSFFSHLIKLNLLENVMSNLNILIIEKSDSFGSGCLGKYGINSNTSAEGFVRIISKGSDEESNGSEAKQTLSPNKHKLKNTEKINEKNNENKNSVNEAGSNNNPLSNVLNNSKINKKVIPAFMDLYNSNPCQVLLTLGSRPGPLPLIGHFLDCVGNCLSDFIYKNFEKKILLLNSEVVSITVDKSNIRKLSENNYELVIKRNSQNFNYEKNSNKYINSQPDKEKEKDNFQTSSSSLIIKTKFLVLASGAKQKFDQKIKTELLNLVNQKDFYHSDYLLQENGYLNILNNLNNKEKSYISKKIVIIGGSHSAFSCAWLLLNGPAEIPSHLMRSYLSNNSETSYKPKINSKCKNCQNSNCCFGNSELNKWKSNFTLGGSNKNKNNFQNSLNDIEIFILYRDHIKVYYHSEKEALNDGYSAFDPKRSVNKNGNVYPFIGIRGDAKDLYRKIAKGQERRVKLLKISNVNEQKSLLMSSHAVIWAGGYTTEKIRIIDKGSKKDLDLLEDENLQFEVDKELHLMMKNRTVVQSLMGIGQGYSTHSIEILPNGKNARADSVNLYNTYIAKKLFRNIEVMLSKEFREKELGTDATHDGNVKRSPSVSKKEIKEDEKRMKYSKEKYKGGEKRVKEDEKKLNEEKVKVVIDKKHKDHKEHREEEKRKENGDKHKVDKESNKLIRKNSNKNFKTNNQSESPSQIINKDRISHFRGTTITQKEENLNLNRNMKVADTTSIKNSNGNTTNNLKDVKDGNGVRTGTSQKRIIPNDENTNSHSITRGSSLNKQVAPTYNISQLQEKENYIYNEINNLLKSKNHKNLNDENATSNSSNNLANGYSHAIKESDMNPQKGNKRYDSLNKSGVLVKERHTINENTNSPINNYSSKNYSSNSTIYNNNQPNHPTNTNKQANFFKNPLIKSTENIYYAPIINKPTVASLSSSTNNIQTFKNNQAVFRIKNRNYPMQTINNLGNVSPSNSNLYSSYNNLKSNNGINEICKKTYKSLNNSNSNITSPMPNLNKTSGKFNKKDDFDIYIPHPTSLNNKDNRGNNNTNFLMPNLERGSSLNSKKNISGKNQIIIIKDKSIPLIPSKSPPRLNSNYSPFNTQSLNKFNLQNTPNNLISQGNIKNFASLNSYSNLNLIANSNNKPHPSIQHEESNTISNVGSSYNFNRRPSPSRKAIEAKNSHGSI
jgi:hypothetical protein